MSGRLRETIRLLLEDEKPKLSEKDPNTSFLSAAKSIPNAGYLVADLDKITTSIGTVPTQVKDAYALFKTVLNEYILENGTERLSPTAEFELSMDKPDPSIFTKLPKSYDLSQLKLTDRDKFDDALKKYKRMFTTAATPKSKVLYDDLVNKYYFEEQAALSVCFDTAKKLSQTKFCVVWSMKGDAEIFKKLADIMAPDHHAAAFCISNGVEAIVVFNGQETADRDTFVHEVGHAQGLLRLATVKAYQDASGAAGHFKKSAFRTASHADIGKQKVEKIFGSDTGNVPQYQIAAASDPDMAIHIGDTREEAQRAAGVLGGEYAVSVMGDLNVPKEALMTRAKNFIKLAQQDFMDEKLDVNVATLLKLGNYVFYRVTQKRFENLTLLMGDERYVFRNGGFRTVLPLAWLRSNTDESANAFRQISSANKLLMNDPAYKALADVRAELWKRQLNVATEDSHVYALLALMPPQSAQSLLVLESVAAADIPATGDKSALGEAYQLASLARGYMNVKRSSSIDLIRSLVREDIKKLR